MRITGVDLHTRQQTIAMLDADTGELVEKTLEHDGKQVREFYSAPRKSSGRDRSHRIDALVSEADGRLGIECRVGHPQKIRKAETRQRKLDFRWAHR
jgi:hypothetical protein